MTQVVDLSGLFPKDPFHQAVIDGLVRDHIKQHGRQMTTNHALELALVLRDGGLPPIHRNRGAEYAERIEYRIQQARGQGTEAMIL